MSKKKSPEERAESFLTQRRQFLQGAVAAAGFGVATTLHVGCGSEAEGQNDAGVDNIVTSRPRSTTLADLNAEGFFGAAFDAVDVSDKIQGLTLGQLDDNVTFHSPLTDGGSNEFESEGLTDDEVDVVNHLFAVANQRRVSAMAASGGLHMEFGSVAHADTTACCCCSCCPCCSCTYAAVEIPARPQR